tara:strand:- start:2075 stop:2572 length:498 start_codon:yes stop_codon:yes gene_type:complete
MKKVYAKAAVKHMNDEEKEQFVRNATMGFIGFTTEDDLVTYITFRNNGRSIDVQIRLYRSGSMSSGLYLISFEASTRNLGKKTLLRKGIEEKDAFSNNWMYDYTPRRRTLFERSVDLFQIVTDGCLKVLKKFDKDADNPFLVMQGYLDEYGSFKTKAKLALSLHF